MITLLLITLLLFNVNYKNINITKRINNTFDNLSNQLPNTWVRLINANNKMIPLYEKSIIKESSINYFSDNLKGYVNNYTISFYYYDLNDKKEYEGIYTPGVKITITVKEVHYLKSNNYEIGGNIL